LPFGRLWYGEPDAISNAIDYAKFRSRSHAAVIRVFDAAGNVIQTHEHLPIVFVSAYLVPMFTIFHLIALFQARRLSSMEALT
jgi:hypothetical protein